MTYLLAAAAGIVAAVVGWLVSGTLAVWIAGLYGMSDFEGARGMFGFLAVGPIGGLIGMVVAIWLVLRRRRGAMPIGAMLGRVGIVLTAIAALVGALIGVRFLTIDTYTNELPPTLEFEIRLPPALTQSDRARVNVELHTDRNVGTSIFRDPWSRTDDGSQIIAGLVPLAFKTTSRLLVLELPEEPTRLFRLRLSRNPGSTPTLGAWQRADFVDQTGQAEPVAAPKDDPVELRYRVRRAGED